MPAEPPPGPADAVDICEVHVDGRLRSTLLARLGWSIQVRPPTSVVIITVDGDGLCRFLESCTESGVVVDRVFRRTGPTADESARRR